MRIIIYTSDLAASPNTLEAGFDFFSVTGSTPLPVQLLLFEAKAMSNQNLLTWTTASEINNDHFAVEKSNDGISFSEIGIVKGTGNSTVSHEYAYSDPETGNGTIYYRLNQVDFDGTSVYSETVALKRNGTGRLNIYPNPVSDVLHISFSGAEDESSLIEIFDAFGNKVFEKSIAASGIDISLKDLHLTGGIYQVRVSNEKSFAANKFVIQ
jgi:hypothetical protein